MFQNQCKETHSSCNNYESMVSISIDWMDLVVSVHDTLFCCIWNSGIIPSLAGVSHVAIQFPAYEKIKSFMAKKGNVKCLLLCWYYRIVQCFLITN